MAPARGVPAPPLRRKRGTRGDALQRRKPEIRLPYAEAQVPAGEKFSPPERRNAALSLIPKKTPLANGTGREYIIGSHFILHQWNYGKIKK